MKEKIKNSDRKLMLRHMKIWNDISNYYWKSGNEWWYFAAAFETYFKDVINHGESVRAQKTLESRCSRFGVDPSYGLKILERFVKD